jgi:TonB family protein
MMVGVEVNASGQMKVVHLGPIGADTHQAVRYIRCMRTLSPIFRTVLCAALLSPLTSFAQVVTQEPMDEVVQPAPPVEDGAAQIYDIVEEMPEYPGGQEAMLKFLAQSIVYPHEMVDAGVRGKVYVEFIVRQDGGITDAKVLRGVAGPLDQEAIRVVKTMPKWMPGRQNGKPVDCRYRLPIAFHLD